MGEKRVVEDLLSRFEKHDIKFKESVLSLNDSISSKVPPVLFKGAGNAKLVIAVQLAFERSGDKSFPTAKAYQLANCDTRKYTNLLNKVRESLKIQQQVTFHSLAVANGCTMIIPRAEQLWNDFKEAYVQSLTASQQLNATAQLERPVWKAAVFWLACRNAKARAGRHSCVRIEKTTLQHQAFCSAADITRHVLKVESAIGGLRADDKAPKPAMPPPAPQRTTRSNPISTPPPKLSLGKSTSRTIRPSTVDTTPTIQSSEIRDNDTRKDNVPEDAESPPTEPSPRTLRKRRRSNDVETASAPKPQTPSRRSKKVAAVCGVVAPTSGLVSMVPFTSFKDSPRYHNFIKWKTEMIAQLTAQLRAQS
ncbi:hypothetical protein BZG36_01377 [Bifiguratus adelaidae]|uniref:ORC6 second cyclin-like domain-containing protein n=1 Tax=Bifiguratus adelaidae TaxID=1938954 RepID=A0A261Y390_9FUNG|nr:hypothetical protein BZG36_01377 [Bifiguratus adelaidae]